jgi:hypothetical protein
LRSDSISESSGDHTKGIARIQRCNPEWRLKYFQNQPHPAQRESFLKSRSPRESLRRDAPYSAPQPHLESFKCDSGVGIDFGGIAQGVRRSRNAAKHGVLETTSYMLLLCFPLPRLGATWLDFFQLPPCFGRALFMMPSTLAIQISEEIRGTSRRVNALEQRMLSPDIEETPGGGRRQRDGVSTTP